jgi:hypothetical protein
MRKGDPFGVALSDRALLKEEEESRPSGAAFICLYAARSRRVRGLSGFFCTRQGTRTQGIIGRFFRKCESEKVRK